MKIFFPLFIFTTVQNFKVNAHRMNRMISSQLIVCGGYVSNIINVHVIQKINKQTPLHPENTKKTMKNAAVRFIYKTLIMM